ncbi:hypothetical protein GR268_38675 [Rhizobium leguminosarum]|nr:hypothetical protein [Rhizobium leguminosarum]
MAGKIFEGPQKGAWIRPVSERSTAELSELDRRFENGEHPSVGDIIRVPMKAASPHKYQTENHQIDDKFYWRRIAPSDPTKLAQWIDKKSGPLWENHSSSTSGLNDRVDEGRAAASVAAFGGSLCLLQVNDLGIHVAVEGAAFNNAKRKVRGDFSYDGHRYRMAITDPKIEAEYLAKGDGEYHIGKSLVCISLGDEYKGHAYKLIASVFME